MAIAYLAAVINSQLDEVTTAVDAGAGAGLISIYDGSRPTTGGAATTLLAQLTMTDPSFPAAAAGVLTASAITSDASADATGTATWFRMTDSVGGIVMDGDVGTSGSDLNLSSVSITIGDIVAISSFVITGGNA